MSIYEMDWMLSDDETGFKELTDANALNNNIEEWLSTPIYEMCGNPMWGHNLEPYFFEPANVNTSKNIELAITVKLKQDIKNLGSVSILVFFQDMDTCIVKIKHEKGIFSKSIKWK